VALQIIEDLPLSKRGKTMPATSDPRTPEAMQQLAVIDETRSQEIEDSNPLPAAIRRKLGQQDPAASQPPAVSKSDTNVPAEQQPPAPQAQEQPPVQPSPQEAPPAPVELSAPAAPPQEPAEPSETPGDKMWRLRAKERAEKLKELQRQSANEIQQLQRQLQAVQQELESARTVPEPVSPDVDFTSLPEYQALKDEYGEDADMFAKLAAALQAKVTAPAPTAQPQHTQPAPQPSQYGQSYSDHTPQVESYLDQQLPNWRQLYNDSMFDLYLQENNLQEAWDNTLSAARAGRLDQNPLLLNALQAFEKSELNMMATQDASNPLAQLAVPAAPQQPAPAATTSLEQQIVPIVGGGAAPASPTITPPPQPVQLNKADIRRLTRQMNLSPDKAVREKAAATLSQFTGERY
jgi:hypothetical protein